MVANKRIGEIRGQVKVEAPFSFSADGTKFAAQVPFSPNVEVLSTENGQPVARLALDEAPEVVQFIGSDRLLVGKGDNNKPFQVWDLKTVKPEFPIMTSGRVQSRAIALSPGGKYVAMATDGGRLHVYDLATGKLAGDAYVPKNGGFDLAPKGLGFSNDGTQLAGVFVVRASSSELERDDRAAGSRPSSTTRAVSRNHRSTRGVESSGLRTRAASWSSARPSSTPKPGSRCSTSRPRVRTSTSGAGRSWAIKSSSPPATRSTGS